MKELLIILLIISIGLIVILVPMIWIMKINYFRRLRHKEYYGVANLFAFSSSEFWIAGITLGFPILGKDKKTELNQIRKKANKRLFGLYIIILIQLVIVVFLNRIEN